MADTWAAGLDEEIEFWARWLRDLGGPWAGDYTWRTDPTTLLQPRVAELLPRRRKRVRILDVGSGPLTILGKRVPGREIQITAVDPLADQYRLLFERAGLDLRAPQRGEAERVDELFARGTFDLAYARNCLDHGYNPLRSILKMLDVTRPGGVVLLDHAIDEGEFMRYAGPHQWNFRVEDDRFVIWQPNHRIDAHSALEPLAEVSVAVAEDESRYMSVVLRKRASRRPWRR
jgi:SAM-dependent methyltransferase